MVTGTKILVILNIAISFALGDSAVDQYSNTLSNSINNANNNYNHVTSHAETNYNHRQNTNHNLNKLRELALPYDMQQLRSAMRDLPYKLKDQTPNLINFLNKPGVARALFFASSATTLAATLASLVNINDRITANTNSIRSTCTSLNSILSCPKPQCLGSTQATTPSNPQAVSCSLGTREGSSYTVIFPVGAISGQTVSTLNAVPGLTITQSTQTNTAASTTVANTAPSILDFNLLRSNMIQAIDILDQKIRDIVMTTAPTCP